MTMDFTRAMRTLQSRPSSLYDPFDPNVPGSGLQTSGLPGQSALSYRAAGSMFAPPSARYSTLIPSRSASLAQGQAVPVPGPLNTWQPDSSYRPYQQVGKFGVALVGPSPAQTPGAPGNYTPPAGGAAPTNAADALLQMADPANPTRGGFVEGLLGGLGGWFGNTGAGVGRFLGSVVDAPLEAAGNVLGLPGALITATADQMRGGERVGAPKWDEDIQALYDEAAKENPLNGILLISQAAKAQWNRDVEAGRITGLWSDFGPATALTDQLFYMANSILNVPMRAVQRAIAGAPGGGGVMEESLADVEEAVRSGQTVAKTEQGYVSTDQDIKNEKYAELQMRLARGDFGKVGSQEARDAMMDQLIVEGALMRDVGDPEQKGMVTWQGMADLGLSLVTDPWSLASFGIGGATKVAKIAQMTANARLYQAVPRELIPAFTRAIEEEGLRVGGYAANQGDRVWGRMASATRSAVEERLRFGALPEHLEQVRVPTAAGVPEEAGLLRPGSRAAVTADREFETEVLNAVIRRPEFAAHRAGMEDALGYIAKYRARWEPAMRPITAIVKAVNDPFEMIGKDRASRWAQDIFGSHMVEGVIRGAGNLDAHTTVQRALGRTSDVMRSNYDKGLGVYAAYVARAYHRAGYVSELRNRLAVTGEKVANLFSHKPDEAITARMNGSRAADVSSAAEKDALRYRPQYLAPVTGKEGERLAIEGARKDAARRLTLMGMDEDEATRTVADWGRDEASLVDGSYFGFSMDAFVRARDKALQAAGKNGKLKGVNINTLTMLGPRTMTTADAKRVLQAIEDGDMVALRKYRAQFDLLYENFTDNLSDADLIKATRNLVEDQVKNGALPDELGSLAKLPDELRRWGEENAEFGYRLGFRPEETEKLWRVTMDPDNPDKVLGINPWIDPVSTVADVPTYNRYQLLRDMLFHNIKGERIMADARGRLATYGASRWGLSQSESDALFARFLQRAQEGNITPRGLSPEQVYNIVKTQGLPEEIAERVGVREAIEALMFAFEGNWRHVGTSQKFTGRAKTALGGQGNWLGMVAERVYPLVRYTLNPLFQVQEMVEPFILNMMRGIKPGFHIKRDPKTGLPTGVGKLDEATLRLNELLARDSKYAPDDQIERNVTVLWGADSARDAFGPQSPMGKLVKGMSLGGIVNVKELKRVNTARAQRNILGRKFYAAMSRVSPDQIAKLRLQYQTDDWGEIAVRYLTDKSGIKTADEVLKPDNLGRRTPINLNAVAHHFDDVPDGDTLQTLVRNGGPDGIDLPQFRDVLEKVGADPAYIERAYAKAVAPYRAEDFWDAYAPVFAGDLKNATRAAESARAFVKQRAIIEDLSEEDWLYKYMADVPMTADSRALGALTGDEKEAFNFMARSFDEGMGRSDTFNLRVKEFRQKYAHIADREHFLVLADDGTVIATGQQKKRWAVRADGHVEGAGAGDEIVSLLEKSRGHTIIHNHPSQNPFSPNDLVTAAEYGAKELIVTSPGISYTLRAPAEGWHTPEWTALFGAVPSGKQNQIDKYYRAARQTMDREFRAVHGRVMEEAGGLPFYQQHVSALHTTHLESVAQQEAASTMAERLGWGYADNTDFRLPVDYGERHRLLSQFAENPPAHLVAANKLAFQVAPLVRHDLRAGAKTAQIAFEFVSEHRPWMLSDDVLGDEGMRNIQDGWEDFFRAEIAPLMGAVLTDVRRGKGGWLSEAGLTQAVNSVMDFYGPNDGAEDIGAVIGFLLKQDEVDLSRIRPGEMLADADAGQRWAMHFTAPRELTAEEADQFAATVAQAAPEVAGWGYSQVLDANGRTMLRFINAGQTGTVDRAAFESGLRLDEGALSKAFGKDDEVLIGADVVDYRAVRNDWKKDTNGEGYLAALRARRPDIAEQLERGLAERSENVLASLTRRNAPEAFDTHIAAIAASGTRVPDFRVAGDWTSRPLHDRVSISLPGGREGLLNDPTRTFSLYEQQLLKAQVIDPKAAYDADPDLYVAMMDAVWRSKDKDLSQTEDLLNQYNAYGFAVMTANAALDTTEGGWALMRAVSPHAKYAVQETTGITGQYERARRLSNMLSERFRADPSARATMFQLDQGLRVSGRFDLHKATGPTGWLDEEQVDDLDAIIGGLDDRLANAADDEARVRLARDLQVNYLDPPMRREGESVEDFAARRALRTEPPVNRKNIAVNVHPFPVKTVDGVSTYVTIARPEIRFKGSATNVSWGRVLGQLDSGLWTSDSRHVQAFLRQQPWESAHAYALRMGSILPGIDVKTGMMAVQTAGPGRVAHGALDTHIMRYIVDSANSRGELEFLLNQLSPGYANTLRRKALTTADGQTDNFRSPTAIQKYLVPSNWRGKPWSPEKQAVMESRLERLIPDEQTREMYRDPEVLRFVSETGGKINQWEGSDYQILSDYFNTVLRMAEVDRLTVAGHTKAAERIARMNGGEWQWLKWDMIRSEGGGQAMDPHVSVTRGIEMLSPRTGLELDRNIVVSRLNTPYDPVNSMVFQQMDGTVMGATVLADDTRSILLGTQHADARTGLHELAHVFERQLDDSMRQQVLTEFRRATGSKRRTWNRDVSEWWADSLLDFAKTRGRGRNQALRSSFEYFRKTLNGIEVSIKADRARGALAGQRTRAINRAEKAITTHSVPLKQAQAATRVATRDFERTSLALRRARTRAQLPALDAEHQAARSVVTTTESALRDAKASVRAARTEARQFEVRAKQALGTPKAGGARKAANAKQAQVTRAEAEVERLSDALESARTTAGKSGKKVAAARRRIPVGELEERRDLARGVHQRALAKQRLAQKNVDDAKKALQKARDLPLRPPKQAVGPIPMSPEMRDIWNTMTTPPETPNILHGTGEHYDLQQEAVYQAALHALRAAEDEAFTLQYYKRGRSLVERSINHPYFGLYPASYMWGKILPEMIRFLIRQPFGIDAPLGGLILSQKIYSQVLAQQNYDAEFRQQMIENTDLWHFVALMTPSLPWEIPVNAPLWMRRLSEEGLEHRDALTEFQQRQAAGDLTAKDYDEAGNLVPPQAKDFQHTGDIAAEMLNYAFGPANAAKEFTGAISGGVTAVTGGTSAAVTEVNNLLGAANRPAAPVEQPAIIPPQQPSTPVGSY